MRYLLLACLVLVQPAQAQRYLSPVEADVVAEVNLLRTQPQKYRELLEQTRGQYEGAQLRRPGQRAITTHEGVAALEEAIEALRAQAPLTALEPSAGLTLAARDHVVGQGPIGGRGHTGQDGSTVNNRTDRYGSGSLVGENIAYGSRSGRDIVIDLLVDDGVAGRGHRLNLLRPEYRQIGVSIGPHRSYGTMCVMDLAAGYTDKAGLRIEPPAAALRGGEGTSPARPAGPLEAARGLALEHYQTLLNDDRTAWMKTWSQAQRGTLGQRWSAARTQAAGQEYRYAGTQKVSPSRMTLVFLRSKSVRCLITLILESGGWKVEEANY